MGGYWFNNYQGFEQKRNRTNRQIFNFYFIDKKPKKVKVFVKKNVVIPSSFIHYNDKKTLEGITHHLKVNPEFKKYKVMLYLSEKLERRKKEFEEYGINVKTINMDYSVFNVELEKNKDLIDKLIKFQPGNYDKLLRLQGFYPERKVTLDFRLEKAFKKIDKITLKKEKNQTEIEKINSLLKELNPNNSYSYSNESKDYEVQLEELKGIEFKNEFLSEQELRNLIWWYLDIEKPLWKEKPQKRFIKARKKLLKILKKEDDNEKIKKISNAIKSLEDKLTIEVEDVGEVKLFKGKYDAKVSWLVSTWVMSNGEKIRELDTLVELDLDEVNGYKVIRHKNEMGLLNAVIRRAKKRKGIVSLGYNSVYDITQSREAAKVTKADDFDIAVENIQPRRDLVRGSYQRMREDFIYLDLFRFNVIFYPFLRTKMPKGSHKLEDVSQFHGLEFEKTLDYDKLRLLEIKRIGAKDKEIRIKAAREIANYCTRDIAPLEFMMETQLFLRFLIKLKKIMPYATYTELGFSPRCVDKYLDKKHWDRCHNQRLFGKKQKMHEDKVQIFKKRYNTERKERLKNAGINTNPIYKFYEDVTQLYFPIEKHFFPEMTIKYPEWSTFYEETKDDPKEHFAALQYIKALMREMLIDHHFYKREKNQFEDSIKKFDRESLFKKFSQFETLAKKEDLDSYYASFDNLKNQYRSIYVSSESELRDLIRQKPRKRISSNQLSFDFLEDISESNKDLYLLREKSEKIRPKLNKNKRVELTRFLNNFNTLEKDSKKLEKNTKKICKEIPQKDFVYYFIQRWRAREIEKQFLAKYRFSVDVLDRRFLEIYENLAKELRENEAEVVQVRGDYLFVKTKKDCEWKTAVKIRDVPRFEVRKSYKEAETDLEELLVKEDKKF